MTQGAPGHSCVAGRVPFEIKRRTVVVLMSKIAAKSEMLEAPIAGTHSIEVRVDDDTVERVTLDIRYRRIHVCPPIGKQKRYPALDLTVIHASEVEAPIGRKPILWKLVTDLEVCNLQEAIEKVPTGISPDMLQQQAQGYLQPANPDPATMSTQDAQKDVAANLVTFTKGGSAASAAKERIITVMAAQMHVSHDQAAKKFDDAQAKLQKARDQAVQDAKNAADASAAAASKGAFAAFGMLLLGAICAAIAGAIAVQRRVHVTTRSLR